MKFNMGCGHSGLPGWVNVDKFPAPAVDQVVDLEILPWPWADDCAEGVRFCHSLEHMGASSALFLGLMRELWRICRHDALVEIMVPHPRHDHFICDPTHVRPITWEAMELFDQDKNRRRIAAGASNSPLGLQLGVDFRLTNVVQILDSQWQQRIAQGLASQAGLEFDARHYNNVIAETHLELRAVKVPAAGTSSQGEM